MHRLLTFAGATLLQEGQPVDSVGGQRKLMALLVLLAAAGRRGISRDRLAAYLWPESDEQRARGALKQSLHVIRRQLGSADVVLGAAELRLNPALITSDLEEFGLAVDAGDHPRVVELYRGSFLDGFYVAGGGGFEEWVEERRAVYARQNASALETLARTSQQNSPTEAAVLWRRLLAQDPFNARAAVGLIEALDAAGERAAALREGRAFERLMRQELGTAPDATVTALMDRLHIAPPRPEAFRAPLDPTDPVARPVPQLTSQPIDPLPDAPAKRVGPWVAAALLLITAVSLTVFRSRSGGGGDENGEQPSDASVAVIPFVNASDHAADEHFADGLTDQLINRLGQVKGLRVSARTSTFALKDRGLAVRAFADTLGVAVVIEGTVRRQADRLKITAQLVDPEAGTVLWSDAYDRHEDDMITVQEEVALAITSALQQRLPNQPPRAPGTPPRPVDSEAYESYLRARYNWQTPLRERLQQAVRYYQHAIERDPGFALAYAGLAEAHVNMAIYGHMPPDEALARARVAADRALALDSDLVEALVARAYGRLTVLEFDEAEADLRRAISVNPNFAWAYHFLALHQLMLGQPREAEQLNLRALVLDPLSLPANATRGSILAQLGDFPAAERELTRALELQSDFTLTLLYLGTLRAARGDDKAALVALQDAALQAPDFPSLPGAQALVLGRLGREAEADGILESLERRAPSDPRARINLAFAHAIAGRTDAAILLLDGARWDVPSLIGLRSNPLLRDFRVDSRVIRLLDSFSSSP